MLTFSRRRRLTKSCVDLTWWLIKNIYIFPTYYISSRIKLSVKESPQLLPSIIVYFFLYIYFKDRPLRSYERTLSGLTSSNREGQLCLWKVEYGTPQKGIHQRWDWQDQHGGGEDWCFWWEYFYTKDDLVVGEVRVSSGFRVSDRESRPRLGASQYVQSRRELDGVDAISSLYSCIVISFVLSWASWRWRAPGGLSHALDSRCQVAPTWVNSQHTRIFNFNDYPADIYFSKLVVLLGLTIGKYSHLFEIQQWQWITTRHSPPNRVKHEACRCVNQSLVKCISDKWRAIHRLGQMDDDWKPWGNRGYARNRRSK